MNACRANQAFGLSSQPWCPDDAVGCAARTTPTASATSRAARKASLMGMSLPGTDAMAQLPHSWCRAMVPHRLNARATLPASLTLPTDGWMPTTADFDGSWHGRAVTEQGSAEPPGHRRAATCSVPAQEGAGRGGSNRARL